MQGVWSFNRSMPLLQINLYNTRVLHGAVSFLKAFIKKKKEALYLQTYMYRSQYNLNWQQGHSPHVTSGCVTHSSPDSSLCMSSWSHEFLRRWQFNTTIKQAHQPGKSKTCKLFSFHRNPGYLSIYLFFTHCYIDFPSSPV